MNNISYINKIETIFRLSIMVFDDKSCILKILNAKFQNFKF